MIYRFRGLPCKYQSLPSVRDFLSSRIASRKLIKSEYKGKEAKSHVTMEAIKKKIAALKMEMDAANEKVEVNETKAKQENIRADRLNDDLRDLQKRLLQLERDYAVTKTQLETSTADLEQCEKSWSKVRIDCRLPSAKRSHAHVNHRERQRHKYNK